MISAGLWCLLISHNSQVYIIENRPYANSFLLIIPKIKVWFAGNNNFIFNWKSAHKAQYKLKALTEMNGKQVEGRELKVSEARPMEERPERSDRPRRSFGDRGGRGGFGGGRGNFGRERRF